MEQDVFKNKPSSNFLLRMIVCVNGLQSGLPAVYPERYQVRGIAVGYSTVSV